MKHKSLLFTTLLLLFCLITGCSQPSEEKIKMEPQQLTSPERSGFTVVEWGGTQINDN